MRPAAVIVAVILLSQLAVIWMLVQRVGLSAARDIRLLMVLGVGALLSIVFLVGERRANRARAHELGASDEQLRLTMEAARAVAWDVDLKRGEEVVFGDLPTLFGLPGHRHVGAVEDFLRRVHADDQAAVVRAVEQARTSRTIYRSTFRVVRTDGTVRHVAASGKFFYDASGEAFRMVGTALDVTERIEMENTLEETRARLSAIVNSANDSVISIDSAGTIASWNGGAQRLFGYTDAEAVGQPITLLVPPELWDEEACIIERLNAGEFIEPYETVRLTKDSRRVNVWLTMSPVRDLSGRIVGASKIAHERTPAELALRESEERFRLMANTAPVMIWTAGVDALRSYFNRTWLEFTGRPIEAELGDGWAEGVHPADVKRCLETCRQAFAKREPFRMEYRLRRHDREYRWLLDTGVPRFTSDGSLAGYIASAIDVTEHKRAETLLANLSQSLMDAHEKERSRIARELHDDIGQRITLLAMELDSLRQALRGAAVTGRVDPTFVENLHGFAIDLSKDVQAMSHRLHSSKLDYLGFAAAAGSLCRELSRQHKLEIAFSSDGIPNDVPKDIALGLYRVLQEALSNAVKHAGPTQVTVSLHGDPDYLELVVSDAGIGFNPDAAVRGDGLGLTSMRERLALAHGEMSIESRKGAGTTVRARVPLNRAPDDVVAGV